MGYKIAVLQDRARFECPADVVVHVERYRGWAASVNELARAAVPRTAEIVVAAGDDMWPEPARTAGQIGREFLERFPDTFGVMQPQGDTFNLSRFYCGSPWLGRGWVERAYGGSGPLWAGYFHNWADMELYWVARCQGVLWERTDLTQRHEHFSRAGGAATPAGAAVPGYWAASAGGHDAADCRLFVARSWQGFPGAAASGGGGAGQPLDMGVFEREYQFIAETHLTRLGEAGWMGGAAGLARRALELCAQRGWTRVAIYGAGALTRALGWVWADVPAGVEVVCVIDDNPGLVGGRLWNWPVVSMADAARLGVRGVVVSSNAHEEAMVERARGMFEGVAGVFCGEVAGLRRVG